MNTVRYNIALIGKTGVGKSTLVNRLVGLDVAKVGVGRPVTEQGFHCYDCDCGGVPTTVHDSWGLEANRADEWRRQLRQELAKRGPKGPIAEWFHTVIYCIGAGAARVEDFEIETMKSFTDEMYRVLVVLTKADQATQSELAKLQSAINDGLGFETKIIPVCAEEKELMSGPTRIFGLDELRRSIVSCFWTTLNDRLPIRCVQLAQDRVDSWAREKRAWVNRNQGIFGAQRNASKLHDSAQRFLARLCDKEDPRSLRHIIQSEVESALRQFFGFSGAYSRVAPDVSVSLRVKFPEISHGLRIGLGSLFAFLSATIVLAPLFLIIKRMSVNDLNEGVDAFASKVTKKIAKLEPSIRDAIRKIVEDITRDNRCAGTATSRLIAVASTEYAGCSKSKVFHRLECKALKRASGGEVDRFASRDDAIQAGRHPCGKCRP